MGKVIGVYEDPNNPTGLEKDQAEQINTQLKLHISRVRNDTTEALNTVLQNPKVLLNIIDYIEHDKGKSYSIQLMASQGDKVKYFQLNTDPVFRINSSEKIKSNQLTEDGKAAAELLRAAPESEYKPPIFK